jgi:hypothetical protein
MLGRLSDRGILSVSRWFSPSDVSETSRLVSLGVATLVGMGVSDPAQHIILVSRGLIATMLTSITPFSSDELARLHEVTHRHGFEIEAAPGVSSDDDRLRAILASRSEGELAVAAADPSFDYSAPTDARPYFFNMLKPSSFYRLGATGLGLGALGMGGVLAGNIRATTTLISLFLLAALLVLAIILFPLVRSGAPAIGPVGFILCLIYFAAIGGGFMLLQIPFLQVFSVYLVAVARPIARLKTASNRRIRGRFRRS